MKWSQESWRKLYKRDSIDWMGLSRACRGTFLQLLKWADDDGYISAKLGKYQAVATMLYCSVDEQLTAEIDELLADGCLVYLSEDKRYFIPSFKAAQSARSEAAERKAGWRAAQKQDKSKTVPGQSEDSLGHARQIRSDQIRADPPSGESAIIRKDQTRAHESVSAETTEPSPAPTPKPAPVPARVVPIRNEPSRDEAMRVAMAAPDFLAVLDRIEREGIE